MVKDKYFQYQDNVNIRDLNASIFEIGDIYSKTELYKVYNMHFKFPYFGFNWDALIDSLSGLDEWMKEKDIIIIHKDLPHLEQRDLKTYISVLYDTCDFWEKHPDDKRFQVFFSKKDQTVIQSFLENINSRID